MTSSDPASIALVLIAAGFLLFYAILAYEVRRIQERSGRRGIKTIDKPSENYHEVDIEMERWRK